MPITFLKNIFKRKVVPLSLGTKAPDFALTNRDGQTVRLSDFKGKSMVVLYFYPKDNTPGCIVESVTFRDHIAEFEAAGAMVIGISSDGVESHQKFAAKYKLPFNLLSDSDNRVRELYHVPPTLGLIPGRTTYVIDRDGIIIHMFNSQFRVDSHVELALQKLRPSHVNQWIEKLDLKPHPEGGYYKETYRTEASTAIYFLLFGPLFSAFHRIKNDEMWHHYDGGVVELTAISPKGELKRIQLGKLEDGGEAMQAVIKGGWWFAAKCRDEKQHALVGCTVAPAFDFKDFELADREKLSQDFPQHKSIIAQLTRRGSKTTHKR